MRQTLSWHLASLAWSHLRLMMSVVRPKLHFSIPLLALDTFGDAFGDASGAIGRAKVTIGCLIDAAVTLAGIVNTHLKKEISDRLAELEDPRQADRATAMNEAVRLNKMLDQLDKQVRWTFPQWKVTGT